MKSPCGEVKDGSRSSPGREPPGRSDVLPERRCGSYKVVLYRGLGMCCTEVRQKYLERHDQGPEVSS